MRNLRNPKNSDNIMAFLELSQKINLFVLPKKS